MPIEINELSSRIESRYEVTCLFIMKGKSQTTKSSTVYSLKISTPVTSNITLSHITGVR